MSDKKQTAVEWLVSELRESKDFNRVINDINQRSTSVRNVIVEAIAMGKEQMIDFADNYVDNCVIPNENMAIPTIKDVPQYYNEVYE